MTLSEVNQMGGRVAGRTPLRVTTRCDTSVVSVFVLVHGAGTGGWLWDDLAMRLRAAGHGVLAPSLRGVGELSADDGEDIGLSDHIDQVVGSRSTVTAVGRGRPPVP